MATCVTPKWEPKVPPANFTGHAASVVSPRAVGHPPHVPNTAGGLVDSIVAHGMSPIAISSAVFPSITCSPSEEKC